MIESFPNSTLHRGAGDHTAMVSKWRRAPLGAPMPSGLHKHVLAFQTILGGYLFPKEELAENPVRSGVDVSSKLPK